MSSQSPEITKLANKLREYRAKIQITDGGWTSDEIAEFIIKEGYVLHPQVQNELVPSSNMDLIKYAMAKALKHKGYNFFEPDSWPPVLKDIYLDFYYHILNSKIGKSEKTTPSKLELMQWVGEGLNNYDNGEQLGRDVVKHAIAKVIHARLTAGLDQEKG